MLCGPAAACAASGAPAGGSGEGEQVSEAYAYSMRQVAGVPVVEESTIVRNSDVQVGSSKPGTRKTRVNIGPCN